MEAGVLKFQVMNALVKLVCYIFLLSLIFSCKKETSCEGCAIKNNKPPITNAGPDQVITLPADSVLLDGRQSSDPDGMISEWLWTKISGPASFNIIKPTDSLTKLKTLVAGTYQFELKVTDNGGLSAKDTMRIIVDSVITTNHPPIANAGADQTITLPTNTINLDGIGSTDPDNNIGSYAWTKISGPSSFNITSSNAVQTQVTNLVQGVYQFELKVADAGGLFSKDTMHVIVNALSNNLPPVAIAGNDTIIQTNQTSCTPVPMTIILNGSNSYDADGSITSYLWNGSNGISNPNAAITTISGLFQGTISIILKVTDNNGAVGYDTMHISIIPANRPLVPAQLIPIGTLSQTRWGISVAAAGDKVLFAGGQTTNPTASTRVDIYNINTGAWATAELSAPRFSIGSASSGNKIYFAGGVFSQLNSAGAWVDADTYQWRSSVVDIYDVSTNTWSVSQLSSKRAPVGASANNKVVFAGSDVSYQSPVQSGIIDVYNTSTNNWSSTTMSEIRDMEQPAVTADKIYFPGGSRDFGLLQGFSGGISYKQIDIYDAISDSWSIDFLSRDRLKMGNIIANNKLYCAGGTIWDPITNWWDVTNSVEIRDLETNTTSFDCLSEAKDGITAVRKNNKIIFFGGSSRFDIYDLTTNSWSIGVLPQSFYHASVISYNNIIYVVGSHASGVLSNQVWKLEF